MLQFSFKERQMSCKHLLLCALLSIGAYAQSISIDVLDATIKDKRVSGASVILQQTGEASLQAKTGANGKATIALPKPIKADATLIVKKEGYSDLVVKCPCDGLTYALSPVMQSLDGLRVVLSWGAQPLDLDSHLVFGSQHVYFDDPASAYGGNAYLDVDDRNSFGPETITIQKLEPNQAYIYAVHNFSRSYCDVKPSNRGCDSAITSIASSGAKVFVYSGRSLVKTYVPPQEGGALWTVFRIDQNGQIVDLNALHEITPNDIQFPDGDDNLNLIAPRKMSGLIKTLAQTDNRAAASAIDPRAEAINKKGEKAYHSGDIEGSIRYYQNAVEIDPAFAQAYSNMGLSYLKLDRFSESIWANRNAIALASGEEANVIRASSYYNIARLYEKYADFSQALRYYELAKAQNANPTYDKAIARVKAKR